MIRTIRAGCLLLTLLACPPPALAWDSSRPEVGSFISELAAEGFERGWLEATLAGGRTQQRILEAMRRPAEKTKPWHEYRAIFLTPERIAAGAEFRRQHADTLARVASDSGVPAEIITAIIGVETFYGQRTGRFRVLDALGTLAFDYPPRAGFFRRELREFFLLAREEGLAIGDVLGSYAGAMGAPQFIPSSYRAYAVDGDGDGRRDLFGSWDDIIASVANYFVAHRWEPDAPVFAPAQPLPGAAPPTSDNRLSLRDTVGGLRERGIATAGDPPAELRAALFELQGAEQPEYWVGFHNAYVITRYNRSVMYALAVYQLAEALAAEPAGPLAAQAGS